MNAHTLELYLKILKDRFSILNSNKKQSLTKYDERIQQINERLNKALNLMLDEKLSPEEYRLMKTKLENDIAELMREKAQVTSIDENVIEYFKSNINFLKKLNLTYENATIEQKIRIQGSVLKNKIVFENNDFRTSIFNEVVSYTFEEIRELKKEKGKIFF